METDKPRELALKILNGHAPGTPYNGDDADDLFGLYGLDQRDRAFVSNLVQGVLRWRLRLDWIIEQFSHFPFKKIDISILNILRMALYQIFFMDKVPESAAVNEAVKLTGYLKSPRHIESFVNGVLRTICRRKDQIRFPDQEKDHARYLSVFYSYPGWLTDKWSRELGTDFTERLFSAQNNFPDINIRANTIRISRDNLIESLAEEGIQASPLPYAPEGLGLKGIRGRVDSLESFRKGLFQVQDQAAQIACHLLTVRPGHRVLDICAGYGGKSSHLAEFVGEKGYVIALDNNRGRLIRLTENAERLGIKNILPVAGDASQPLSSLFKRGFDRVILDAPCSGLGVISRHPDIKWNRKNEDIPRLAAMQKTFLKAGASVVEKGGEILYVVCTVSREENEGVVKGFLEENNGFSLVDLREQVPGWRHDLIDHKGFYKTYPHIHNMDGFFAALFRKDD